MSIRVHRWVGLLGLAVFGVGCGLDASPLPTHAPASISSQRSIPSPAATVSPTLGSSELVMPPALTLDEVPLTCGSPLAFSVDSLETLPGAEHADHPAARSLRQLVADGLLPSRSGWRLVVFNEEGVLFLLPGTADEGVAFWSVELGPAAANWQFVRMGQCDIQPAFAGLEAARWELAPGQSIGPDTQTFEVQVFEQGCASGASPEGRIVGPAVIAVEGSVTLILSTRPLPGPQTCQPGPPATVRVELPEPLGDRQLLDGSTFPAEPRS